MDLFCNSGSKIKIITHLSKTIRILSSACEMGTMGTHKQVSTKKSNHCAFQFFSDTQLQKPHPLAVQAFHLWRSANQKPAGLKKWVSGVEQELVFCGFFVLFFYFRGDAQVLIKMTKWDYL